MKRYFNKREKSPVRVYHLFKYGRRASRRHSCHLPTYYTRHAGKIISLKTEKLSEAKTKIKKIAGDDRQNSKRRSATIGEVRVGQKTVRDVKKKIQHGLRPFFGEMLADQVDSVQIGRWKDWRFSHRLRKSGKPGCDKLMPASTPSRTAPNQLNTALY